MRTKELTYFSMTLSYFMVFKFIGGFMPLWNIVYALFLSHVIVALFIHYAGNHRRKIILLNFMINITTFYRVTLTTIGINPFSMSSAKNLPPFAETDWFIVFVSLCFYIDQVWRYPRYFEKKMDKTGIFDKIDRAVANLQ